MYVVATEAPFGRGESPRSGAAHAYHAVVKPGGMTKAMHQAVANKDLVQDLEKGSEDEDMGEEEGHEGLTT